MSAPDATILAQCIRECVQARDGRGARWPKVRCVDALLRQGDDPVMARISAEAAIGVAESIRRVLVAERMT